ncbi:MAG: hypothetical protein U0637_13470 [Phycisphaerales bacterium]
MPSARALCIALVCFAPAACAQKITPSYESPEPGARNAAIVSTAARGDMRDIPQLVRMLDSDDPTTRVLAIRTLERLTGQTFGYDPHAEAFEREASIERWAGLVREQAAAKGARP